VADQLENKLVEAITDITANLAQAKSFVLSELPDVLQQYLLFNTVKSCGYTVLGLILVILCVYGIYKVIKNSKYGKGKYGLVLYFAVFTIIGGIMFFLNLVETIQLLIAPKVWLLENLSYILKSLK
jgi:hypothetical protein